MKFNVDKCKVMHVGRRNLNSTYVMNDMALGSINEEKDLGVFITDDLKWSTHCQQAYTRANRVLGMINRTITSRDKRILLSLYKTLVRPHLEYCSPAWSPYYKKDKQLLERVQHRFTRMLPGLKSLEYDDRLKALGMWSLEERRNRADLLEVFKTSGAFFWALLIPEYTRISLPPVLLSSSSSGRRRHLFDRTKDGRGVSEEACVAIKLYTPLYLIVVYY